MNDGTLEFRRGHWYVRVSLPDRTRPRFRLPDGLDEKARHRMRREIARRERARVEAELAAAHGARTTVQRFGEMWTSGELFRRHGEVKRLKLKKSAGDDAERLARYVYPAIGARAVADITERDIERVLAEATDRSRRGSLAQATKRQLYQVLHRLFDLAVRPGRLREDNPVGEHLKPAPGKPKLFGYLFPDELTAVLRNTDVPLTRRVLYMLAVYTGLRRGSLTALRWDGIDFDHGTLTSLDSKTDLPQMFELATQIRQPLKRWREVPKDSAMVPDEQRDLVVPLALLGTYRDDTGKRDAWGREAEALRADLLSSGVTRALLFGAKNVQPIRFHDLRATFVTWALRQGRGKFWIQDRTGHITDEQMARYARAARTLADLQIEPFPEVEIPELQ